MISQLFHYDSAGGLLLTTGATGFEVIAPSDVPSGTSLTLQIKRDDETTWSAYADSIAANQRVTVAGLTACQWYALRWQTARASSSDFAPRIGPWRWVGTKCAEGQALPDRIDWTPADEAGYIVGQVLDARTGTDKNAVSYAILWAGSLETGDSAEAISDELGRYRIGPLEPGSGYSLSVYGLGYSRLVQDELTLPASGLIQDVELVRTGVMGGTVLGADNEPVANAVVHLLSRDEPQGEVVAETANNGHYCVCNIDVASLGSTYDVVVMHPAHSFVQLSQFVPPCYSAADQVSLGASLPARTLMKGYVTIGQTPPEGSPPPAEPLPLEGALLYIQESSRGLLLDDQIFSTDSDGFYQVSVNAPASYNLVVGSETTTSTSVQVDVEPDIPITVPTINLPAPGSISGTVTNLDGQTVTGAVVEVTLDGSEGWAAEPVTTDAAGAYSFPALPPMEGYIVSATLPTAQGYAYAPVQGNVQVLAGQPAIVNLQGETIAPVCQIIAPSANDAVSGMVTVKVDVSDNQAVGTVVLKVNGDDVDLVTLSDPLSGSLITDDTITLSWDSSAVIYENRTLTVYVHDICGNQEICQVTVSVNNSNPPGGST